jgi:DUF971 family protein
MHSSPSRIDVIGNTLALQWSNGEESFIDAPLLRTHSPSAENKGETDIFGQIHGGKEKTEYPNIKILKVLPIGNYAIRILFSDGHSTGIFSWDYLRKVETLSSIFGPSQET